MTVTTNINWIGWQKGEKVSSDSFTLKYCLVYLSLHIDFDGTVVNSLGDEKEVVLRTLMEMGYWGIWHILIKIMNVNKWYFKKIYRDGRIGIF